MQHHVLAATKPKRRQRQTGFLLVQLSVIVLLLSVAVGYAGLRYWQASVRDIEDTRARLVGSTIAAVNDAAKTYATTFFTQIQRGQDVTRGTYTVPAARVQAPTTADLHGLGMLPARSANPVVYNGQEIGFTVRYTIDTTGCVVPTCNVQILVTSTNPMLLPTGGIDVRRATMAASIASPGNAGVAMPTAMGDPGVFVGTNGIQIGTNASGIPGLIAVANGYDSSGFMEFDRRDGSLPRTGDINMQDTMGVRHSIREADEIQAQGRIKTGEYLDLNGLPVSEGDACEKDGLVARGEKGLILSCQSGVWSLAVGSGAGLTYVGSEIASVEWVTYNWGPPIKCPAPAKFAFINGTNNYSPNYPTACEIIGQGTEDVNVKSKYGSCYFDCWK